MSGRGPAPGLAPALLLPAMALVAFPAAAVVAAPTAAQGPGGSAVVRVETAGGTPLAAHPVVLEVHDAQQTIAQRTGSTDASGVARFDELPTGPDFHLRATVDYGDVEFASAPTPFSTSGAPTPVGVTVYETTSEGVPLHLDFLHLILDVREPGLAQVAQVMVVRNVGETAWISEPASTDGRREGLVIPLPPAARQPAALPPPEGGLDVESLTVEANRMVDRRPVPSDGRQVAVAYQLIGGPGDPPVLELTLPYPTQSVELFAGGPGLESIRVEAPGFVEQEARNMAGQVFRTWTHDVVPAGGTIRVALEPLSAGLPPSTWALIGLGAACLLAVAGSMLARSPAATTDRDALVLEAARLDRDHEHGLLSDSEHARRRAAVLEQLLLLEDGSTSTTRAEEGDGTPGDAGAGGSGHAEREAMDGSDETSSASPS